MRGGGGSGTANGDAAGWLAPRIGVTAGRCWCIRSMSVVEVAMRGLSLTTGFAFQFGVVLGGRLANGVLGA